MEIRMTRTTLIKTMTTADAVATLALYVGDDGSGDLRVIVDYASDGDTIQDLIDVVNGARAEWAAEQEREVIYVTKKTKFYLIDGDGPWTLEELQDANADAPIAQDDVLRVRMMPVGSSIRLGGGASPEIVIVCVE